MKGDYAKQVNDRVKQVNQGHQVATNTCTRNSDRSEKPAAGFGKRDGRGLVADSAGPAEVPHD